MNQQFLNMALIFILAMVFMNGFAGIFGGMVCNLESEPTQESPCQQFVNLQGTFNVISQEDVNTLKEDSQTISGSSDPWSQLASFARALVTSFTATFSAIIGFAGNFGTMLTIIVAGFGIPILTELVTLFSLLLTILQVFGLGFLIIVMLQAVRPSI